MRRRLAMGVLLVLFVGGGVLWEYVLSTPVRNVMLMLDQEATSPRWTRLTWAIEREGREIAHGVINAREGRLPLREVLGAIPLKRGRHVLRAGFVAGLPTEGALPLLERRATFEVGDGEVVLVPLEGETP